MNLVRNDEFSDFTKKLNGKFLVGFHTSNLARNDTIITMLTLLRLIILRNSRALLTLFFVTLFSSVGFITLGQLTTNIESSVASETRPLF